MNFNIQNYPYRPDVVMGYKGNKVALNIIPSTQTMWDSKYPDGAVMFKQKILKGLCGKNKPIETVAIPITSVINYDIKNLKMSMNEDYNFMRHLNSQLSDVARRSSLEINF